MKKEMIEELIKGLALGTVMGITNARIALILAKDMEKKIIIDTEKILIENEWKKEK